MSVVLLLKGSGSWLIQDQSGSSDETSDVFLCSQLDQWPRFISARFQYTVYPITFSVGNAEEWKKLFKPCAAQRLFLPVRLQRLHSLTLTLTLVSFFSKQDFFFQLALITFVVHRWFYTHHRCWPEPSLGRCFCNLIQSKLPSFYWLSFSTDVHRHGRTADGDDPSVVSRPPGTFITDRSQVKFTHAASCHQTDAGQRFRFQSRDLWGSPSASVACWESC